MVEGGRLGTKVRLKKGEDQGQYAARPIHNACSFCCLGWYFRRGNGKGGGGQALQVTAVVLAVACAGLGVLSMQQRSAAAQLKATLDHTMSELVSARNTMHLLQVRATELGCATVWCQADIKDGEC